MTFSNKILFRYLNIKWGFKVIHQETVLHLRVKVLKIFFNLSQKK